MNFNNYWEQDQEAHGSSTNFKDEREVHEFAEDFFNYGIKEEKDKALKFIDKLIKFEKYFRRSNLRYQDAKKNMVFRFHEIFEEEMKETETGKKWRKSVYGKENE